MNLRPEEAEEAVIHEISVLIRNASAVLSEGRQRLDEIGTEIENLMARCASAADISMKYINLRLTQLEKEKDILSHCTLLPEDMRQSFPRLSSLENSEKKEIAALLIDRIEIRGRNLEIHWKPELSTED